LIAVDLTDGTLVWSQELPENAIDVLIDMERTLIYLATADGVIETFQISDLQVRTPLDQIDPLWRLEIEMAGAYALIPLPNGGIIVSTRSSMRAISQAGEVLWRSDPTAGIIDWVYVDGALMMITKDSDAAIWLVDERGASAWTVSIKGHRVVASEEPFIYAEDGVYSIDLDAQSAELFYSLPEGFARSGDMVELPEGGFIVAHTDLGDKRLIALDASGALGWERSIASLSARRIDLMTLGGRTYMLTEYSLGRSTGIDIFHVNLDDGALRRVFSGGTRIPSSGISADASRDELLLINIAGVGIVAFDPELALEASAGGGVLP
jgi:outer membrane protein assembly factor BamB